MGKSSDKSITKIKNISIHKFRGLRDINLDIADRITLICGKNGTSKSTILGIIAQVFSFEKDYTTGADLKQHKTLDDKDFKSVFSDHFRLSPEHDRAGSAKLDFSIYDAYQGKTIEADLQLTAHADRRHRFVVRQKDEQRKITNSRNFTHPVIYLSLRRLMPISQREKYSQIHHAYFNNDANKSLFCKMTSKILLNSGKQITQMTSTTGTVSASVSHGNNYDENSVSVGEDNVGQIVSALMSFKKLREDLSDEYHGGILLIDEVDAGLFPAAQRELLTVFNQWATDYNLQIIFTSHSPIMINEVLELQRKADNRHILHYLTDSFGDISLEKNRSWEWIENDLSVQAAKINLSNVRKEVSVFFEDRQALDLFKSLMLRSKYNKLLKIDTKNSMGCSLYIELSKLLERMKQTAIIVLDGDTLDKVPKGDKNILKLPTCLAPDQFLFLILFNLGCVDTR